MESEHDQRSGPNEARDDLKKNNGDEGSGMANAQEAHRQTKRKELLARNSAGRKDLSPGIERLNYTPVAA